MSNYILEPDGSIRVEPDLLTWAKWFETNQRHIAKDELNGVVVSTVFLGIDHSFGEGPPVLFETMIFGGPHDQWQDRYTSKEAALAGHKRALDMAKRAQVTIKSFTEDSHG